MIGLLSFIVVIGLGLVVHEFGHFLAAKKCGVTVPEFSIGMGPKIGKFKRGETDYVLRLFPVGGFVAMASILEGNPHDGCFERKSKRQRAFILGAGPFMNFVLAFILVLAIGVFQGQPHATNQLAHVYPDMAASLAGLEVGDRIVSYQGAPIQTGEELVAAIHQHQGEVNVELIRDGELLELVLVPAVTLHEGRYISQVGIQVVTDYTFSLGYAIDFGFRQFGNIFYELVRSLQMLVVGEVGISQLSGPLGVYQMASMVAHHSIYAVLMLAALINVNLGLFNLFPLPALDGGRLVFIGVETLIRKPLPAKLEGAIHMVGFCLFMGLFVFTFINDLMRLRG